MALENIIGATDVQRRWALAFGFGLIHGFGFSFALRDTLQFAGSHLLTSLLAFNVGVEFGQLFVLALLVPALALLFKSVVQPRMGTIVLSAFVAHTAWHWTTERWDALQQFTWPTLGPVPLLWIVRVLIVIVIVGALAWLLAVKSGRVDIRQRSGESDA